MLNFLSVHGLIDVGHHPIRRNPTTLALEAGALQAVQLDGSRATQDGLPDDSQGGQVLCSARTLYSAPVLCAQPTKAVLWELAACVT